MIMRSLQPRFARHLMGFPQTDFGSLVQALYGIEEGISRGHRSSRRPPFQSQFLGTPYQMIQHDQYRPVAPIRPVGPTYLHPPPQPVYATQAPQRPPMQFHHQYRAPPPPRPVRQFTQLGMPLSRAFQRLRAGHDTDSCSALRHAIQDLIDQGLVDLGRPGVATDPLPTHDTRAVPPPPEGVHLIEFAGDEIFMMGWDGEAPQPISLYEESDFVGYIPRQQIPRPFSLTPDRIYGPPPVSPIVTRSGRVAQPPPVDRPFAGIAAREEVQREDDEILRQLRTTQARISIWSLLASSSTHRDALVRALGQIRVDTATTPEGLIHMLTADRATCRRVPSVLLDNGSALNVCPLVTAIALGFSPDDFGPSTQTVRAYDGTQRTVMGTLSTHVMIGPVSYSIVFQVLRIQSSFNLLLGRPWIHEAGAIPSSLHQKVKFIHEGRIITIQSDRDIITSSEPVLHISHSEDDLHLTGFTFDEVQVVSLEDGSRDMVPMSFDQHSSTLVLSMMRGMSYLPGIGERARMSGIPFDYPLRPYTFQLADYFIRGSEHTPRTEGTVHIPETVEIQDIQQALGQIHLDTGTTEAPGAMIVTPPSPDRASRIFDAAPHGPHTVFDMFGVFVLETDEDDSIPDAYTDDMDFIGIGRILDAAPRGPLSAFDISGVSVLDDESVLDVVTSDFASVEGASDSVDPPLSFDTMSGFVTRFDDISDGNNDMSIFEYLNVSQHFPLIAPPAPTTHIYDVDDVGDTDDPLVPREIRIGSSLSPDERSRLIDLLRPVKQKLRRLHPRWSLQVKEEIQKQLSVGFLSVVEYPEWLANVVPVPKKDGKVRVCVDFRDLNKASPKDDFPLPHIDMLVDSTAGHPMLSFMDGFSGYNQILMAPEDMVKTSFITEWGTYCYRVMPFGLKNAGATYQRAATTLFHDMMHRDVEVYVDDMIVKSRDRADHLAALQRFFERIRQFRLRLNPKKCTFGVTSGKLLGHIVSERAYLPLLRKNQPTVWNDDCQRAFERIKECLLSPPVLVPPTPGRPLLLYLSVSDMALGCMLAQLDDLGKERAIYYLSKRMLEYECKYIMIERLCLAVVWATRRLRHYMTEYSVLLVSRLDPLRYLFDRPVLTGRLMRWLYYGWRLYFDGAANQSGFGIGILLISPQGDHIPRSVRLAFSDHHRLTNNIVEYEACITGLETALDLGIRQLEIHGDSNLVIKQTQGIWRTRDEKLKPYHAYLDLLIDRFDVLRSAPAYYCLIGEIEDQIELPWYHDIYQFLSCDAYPESASAKDRRALRQLATRFVVCGDALYRRSPDGLLLLCLDRASADRVMREVHAGVCGPHMGGHMLARKIMRTGYFWLTMETDCCQFVQRCQECQMHGDLIHVPPSELHALASPWPFSVWGIDIIGKISPKSSSGHEYILVAIDYFTKWVEAASYARLTAARVAKFIRSHIICRYGVPHELISDRGVHFKGEVDTLIQEYGIQHHRSSAYRPQTNGAVEAANKNIKRILRKMVETSRDWSEEAPFRIAVLPVEIEMRSLRVALEQHISEAEWAQSRYDQLSLLDEKRLRAADHVQAYQRKMTRAFRKRVKPRKFQRGDLVLKVLRGLISDPRGKFRPSWSGPYCGPAFFTCVPTRSARLAFYL
ncbi:Retrovirus-related Pol polyprotein from transposon 412 [Vitis vinifera]|uniref:Retrovirus-related Pol polyprotein from transposon 412 n=1 Tax=Vitis vinifera TaxID=29760 RepID=A0A438G9A2_VITVI|nr:Retrovirus-related Pol polyprotein from transposon 412 [Vitis vinifera]